MYRSPVVSRYARYSQPVKLFRPYQDIGEVDMNSEKSSIRAAALIAAALVFHAWYPAQVSRQAAEHAIQHREKWIDRCMSHLNEKLNQFGRQPNDWSTREEVCGKFYAQNFPNGAP